MKEQVWNYIRENEMLKPGDRVVAAVSGGADSICLLAILDMLTGELPAFLRVVHVHHGLRGTEADRDEAFVRRFCAERGLYFHSVHRQVGALAREQGLSVEEAGRKARYEALEAEAWEWDCEAGDGRRARIAVAHHQGDQAETILHNLLRGSGLRGLAGMRPVQGRLIRPLLCVSREQIREWLAGEQLAWCEDSTNGSEEYTRNRLRLQILPLLEETVNARAAEHMVQAGYLIGQADRYLEREAGRIFSQGGRIDADGTVRIQLLLFQEQEEILKTYLLRHMLERLQAGKKDVSFRHYRQLTELADRAPGSRIDLPGTLWAERDYDWLCIGSGKPSAASWEAEESGLACKMEVFSLEKGMEIPKNQYTKWFDYDKIKNTLSVRSRRQGDYLLLPGGGKKTITRYMIDEKIPRKERDRILLLAEGSHILWVIGRRISEYYKITEHTKTILQVTADGGKEDGR